MSISEKIKSIVAQQLNCNCEILDDTTPLFELGYDSLDVFETIFLIEEAFDIDISFNNFSRKSANIQKIGDLVQLVESMMSRSRVQ